MTKISRKFNYLHILIKISQSNHLFIGIIVAAIITPTPDVATQTVFAVPMILLYLLGVLVAWVFGKKREE